jgi:biotin carboxyl carrier protein
LSEWKTRLPRSKFTEQLLRNHHVPINSGANDSLLAEHLNVEADRAMLQTLLPNTLVTDETLATYYMFDKIGLTALQQADHSKVEDGPRNMTDMIDSPEFVHSQNKKEGDSFYLHGEKITILKIQPDLETGRIHIDYHVQGHIIRTSGINPNAQAIAGAKQIRLVKDPKIECGAPMAGRLLGFLVKPGDRIKSGQVLARVEAMKMEHTLKASVDMDGSIVDQILASEQDIVEGAQVLVTVKPK